MKKHAGLLAVLLVLALILCLFPTAALADPSDGEGEAPAETTETEAPAEETPGEETETPPEDTPEEAPSEEPEEPEEPREEPASSEEAAEEADENDEEAAPVIVAEGETYYAKDGDTVYNNGGLVYANGGLIYNNGGLVYVNDGIVYNNNGVAYANGGTVYNNNGRVYSNGALIYTFGDDVEESHIFGFHRVALAGDYDTLADMEGLTDGQYLNRDESLTVTPHEGYTIVSAETEAGTLTENEDGSWTLSGLDADTTLTLIFRPEAPVFDLESGTYAEEQQLTITASEGAEIWYTTDGSEPREDNSTHYDGPIALTEGMTVTAVAIAAGAEPSEATAAAYAFVSVTAPEFEEVEAGYGPVTPLGFTVENRGSVDAGIESVRLEGEQAELFALNSGKGGAVKAGSTDSETWLIGPAVNLEAGSYKVTAIFTLQGGAAVEAEVVFTVK